MSAAAEQSEVLGYRIEWQDDDRAPAILYGSRGAIYSAVRIADPGSDWCYLVDGSA